MLPAPRPPPVANSRGRNTRVSLEELERRRLAAKSESGSGSSGSSSSTTDSGQSSSSQAEGAQENPEAGSSTSSQRDGWKSLAGGSEEKNKNGKPAKWRVDSKGGGFARRKGEKNPTKWGFSVPDTALEHRYWAKAKDLPPLKKDTGKK